MIDPCVMRGFELDENWERWPTYGFASWMFDRNDDDGTGPPGVAGVRRSARGRNCGFGWIVDPRYQRRCIAGEGCVHPDRPRKPVDPELSPLHAWRARGRGFDSRWLHSLGSTTTDDDQQSAPIVVRLDSQKGPGNGLHGRADPCNARCDADAAGMLTAFIGPSAGQHGEVADIPGDDDTLVRCRQDENRLVVKDAEILMLIQREDIVSPCYQRSTHRPSSKMNVEE